MSNSGVKDKRGGWQLFLKKCASHIVDCAAFLFSFSFLLGVQCNSWCTEMEDLSLIKLLQALLDHRDEKC